MWVFFFFQAEDGIRDLVRSRGLGDVYKRQGQDAGALAVADQDHTAALVLVGQVVVPGVDDVGAVSYTHLTLPTSDLV